MKKHCEGYKEIGKGIIAFTNLFSVLIIVNMIITHKISTIFLIAIIYTTILGYLIAFKMIEKGENDECG